MFIFGEDQEKMKLNELGMQKLGRQNSCQQAKQIMLVLLLWVWPTQGVKDRSDELDRTLWKLEQ